MAPETANRVCPDCHRSMRRHDSSQSYCLYCVQVVVFKEGGAIQRYPARVGLRG